MTPRWTRIVPFVLCMAFAALGIGSLAAGHYITGGLQLAFSTFWLMTYWDKRPAVLGGGRDGV